MFWKVFAVIAGSILFIVLILAAVGIAVSYNAFKKTCRRKPPKHTSFETTYSERKLCRATPERLRAVYDWYNSEKKEELSVLTSDGLRLYASALNAKSGKEPKGIVLIFHGYRSSGVRDLCFQIEALHNEGYHLLVADQRSHGKSQGKYICYGVREREDVLLWRDAAAEHFGKDLPIAFMGLSMGGATVLMASGLVDKADKNVKCVIADCPFSSPWQIVSHVLLSKHNIKPMPLMYFINVWCRLIAKFNLKTVSGASAVASSQLPVLIFHGLEDRYVPIEQSRQVAAVSRERVNLVEIEGAQHAEAIYFDEKFYLSELFSFLDRNMKNG